MAEGNDAGRAAPAVRDLESWGQALFEGIDDAVFVHDLQGRILEANTAACRRLGYARDELLRLTTRDVDAPDFAAGFEGRLHVQLAQGRLICEGRHRTRDGRVIPVEINTAAVRVEGRTVVLAVMRDLTERNHFRDYLARNEKLASIGLLSAGVAHEINNPLAFVSNNLAVLERDSTGLLDLLTLYQREFARLAKALPDLGEQARRIAEDIDLPYLLENLPRLLSRTREGVDRVTRIVHSLRGLARTDAPRPQDASIADLAEACLEIIRGRLRRHQIELRTDFGPTHVRCVPTQMSQVLLNLFINALQAVEAARRGDRGWIRVGTKQEGENLMIEVADNGTGIAAEHLDKVFDPFFTTKDVGEGTGLGLSISHSIVAAHGGRIDVDSRPGEGTTFRVYLPLRTGESTKELR
jgi:PAS domain S-box-containing protein